MIKKIFRSESDLYNLSFKRTNVLHQGVNLDYKKIVVNKPWGYEYLLFENDRVAIWILCLKKDSGTSMHCHPNKKTSLTVLSGQAVTSTLDTQFLLNAMDGLFIDSGVFHSTRSASDGETFLMEIETPPNKNDLVRLKDQYGRENKTYEGQNFMSDKLADYNYCDLHFKAPKGKYSEERNLVGKNLKVVRGSFDDIVREHITDDDNVHICLLEGNLTGHNGELILDAGESVTSEFIKNLNGNVKPTDCHMLIIY
jgi:mannose-6-phosphate isomerase-like protein (cupin superfamily)